MGKLQNHSVIVMFVIDLADDGLGIDIILIYILLKSAKKLSGIYRRR